MFIQPSHLQCCALFPLGDERTDLYRSANPAIRWVFWHRLHALFQQIQRSNCGREECLDFGGGSGAMLPSLATLFNRVHCIDLDTALARRVVKEFDLGNVDLTQQDISKVKPWRYNAIVAADVLEHFRDLGMPISAIKQRMNRDGWLFTSLQTENAIYRAIRVITGKQKPADHYHSASEVEAALRSAGFVRRAHSNLPVPGAIPLFSISSWQLAEK